MQQYEVLEFVLDTLAELATLHTAAAAAAERAWSVLDKYDMADLRCVPCGDQHPDCLSRDRLVVNPATFTVEWHGQRCNLGPTILFRLIQRLARRPGIYLTYDALMEDVWEQPCSNTTIRSAVKRLRRAMCDAGMPELAAAIRGRGECYGVFLDDNCS
jgi:DNA-binding response OmpR family regulator